MNNSNLDLSPRKLSTQMKAVVAIFAANQELTNFIGKEVNLSNESIDWESIFSTQLSSGLRAACEWAFAVWRDEIQANCNLFDASLSMDAELKAAILRALRLRWGIAK
jgi:hypothetical protein